MIKRMCEARYVMEGLVDAHMSQYEHGRSWVIVCANEVEGC